MWLEEKRLHPRFGANKEFPTVRHCGMNVVRDRTDADGRGCTLLCRQASKLQANIGGDTDWPASNEAPQERIISTSSNKHHDREELRRLLGRTSVIRNGCDLDLLVFLYRHPRTLLTSEQIAAFVGRDMKLVANALDAFIAAGLVERLHNPTHAARLYLLAVHGPEDKGLKRLLDLATTRQGRHEILAILNSGGSHPQESEKDLHLVKGACA